MKIIKPSFEILNDPNPDAIMKAIEIAGRTCYKSEDKIGPGTADKLIRNIIGRHHESVLEHQSISVRIICDRGITHEIVRHRLASYSQESTRYCNYSHGKFDGELTFIDPCFWDKDSVKYNLWLSAMKMAEVAYLELLAAGATAQEARDVLTNSLKSEIVCTMNLREWRWFCIKRCPSDAHPQMREISIPLLHEFKRLLPIIFEDINY